MPRRRPDGTPRVHRSMADDERDAASGTFDELALVREAHAALEREAVRLAERDAAETALEAVRRELEVAVAERDRAVWAAQRDADALLALQSRVAEIDRRAVSVDGALLAAADRVRELERVVAENDREAENDGVVLQELDRQIDAARQREDVRLDELRAAQNQRDAAILERDRAVAAALDDAETLLELQARVTENDRWVVSVNDQLAVAATRLQDLEGTLRAEDDEADDRHSILETLGQHGGAVLAQLRDQLSEFEQRVKAMDSSLASAVDRAVALEERADEATTEAARLRTDIESLTLRIEEQEETGAPADPARNAGIQVLLDELRRLLAEAIGQAEVAAEERTHLEQQLRLHESKPDPEEQDRRSQEYPAHDDPRTG